MSGFGVVLEVLKFSPNLRLVMLVIEEMVSVGYEINNKLNPKEYVTKIRVRFCHCLRLSGYALVIKKKKNNNKDYLLGCIRRNPNRRHEGSH